MKRRILFIALFFILGLGGRVLAQPEEKGYTLDQFYRAALARAEQIGLAEESVAIAQYQRKQALAVLIPTITAFGSHNRYSEEKTLGGTTIQPQWDGAYGISLGQSVTLNGRELTALKIAEQGIEKSALDLEAVKEAYLFTVASSFFDVTKASQAVLIAEASVTRLTAHKNAVATRLKLGDVPKTELFRTEAELASANADLIRYRNVRKLARAVLSRFTGIQSPFEIKAPNISAAELETIEFEGLKQMAQVHRAELKSYAMDETIALNQVKYARGAYWPRLSVEGSWTFIEQDPEPLLDESAVIGANLTIDIFDGGLRKSRVQEARSRQKQAKLALENAKNNISIEIEEAYLNWQTQQGVIASLESQLSYAKENYDASIRLFEHGMANSVDVMDANTLLATAQWQLAEARCNLQLAVLGVERSVGVFLTAVEKRLKQQLLYD